MRKKDARKKTDNEEKCAAREGTKKFQDFHLMRMLTFDGFE